MKLLLPVATIVLAAASCCCCGSDIEQALKDAGVNVPSGASDGRVMFAVPANESVRVLDIDPEDAYYSSKGDIIGKTCTTDEASSYKDGGWHGGSVHCNSTTDTYYFYKAAYADLGPAPVVAGGTVVPAIPGLRVTHELPTGSVVKILDVASDDAYFSDRSTIMGKTCTLDGASSFKDGEWHGGSVNCTDGSNYYFYKAAYELVTVGGGAAPVVADGRATYSVPNGSRVKVVDIASDDAYYSDRAAIIGKLCTLSEDSSFKDGSWHGGQVSCADGSSYYFYKAAYVVQGLGAVGGAVGGGGAAAIAGDRVMHQVRKGIRVRVLDIASDDAYYSDRGSIIGKRCTTDEPSSYKEGGWQGGQVRCDDGSSYYFYKAAYEKLDRP